MDVCHHAVARAAQAAHACCSAADASGDSKEVCAAGSVGATDEQQNATADHVLDAQKSADLGGFPCHAFSANATKSVQGIKWNHIC